MLLFRERMLLMQEDLPLVCALHSNFLLNGSEIFSKFNKITKCFSLGRIQFMKGILQLELEFC